MKENSLFLKTSSLHTIQTAEKTEVVIVLVNAGSLALVLTGTWSRGESEETRPCSDTEFAVKRLLYNVHQCILKDRLDFCADFGHSVEAQHLKATTTEQYSHSRIFDVLLIFYIK